MKGSMGVHEYLSAPMRTQLLSTVCQTCLSLLAIANCGSDQGNFLSQSGSGLGLLSAVLALLVLLSAVLESRNSRERNKARKTIQDVILRERPAQSRSTAPPARQRELTNSGRTTSESRRPQGKKELRSCERPSRTQAITGGFLEQKDSGRCSLERFERSRF
jgi:hypothetical protein